MRCVLLSIGLLLLVGLPFGASAGEIVHRNATYMGTWVGITVVADNEDAGAAAIAAGFAEIARLEGILSTYRKDSDLSRINARAGQGPLKAPPEVITLTRHSIGMARLSGGAFNPLLEPVIRLWGIPDHPHLPSPRELDALRPLIHMGALRVSEAAGTVTLAHPGMALSFGGIAKGYTADRVMALLKKRGITAGIVAMAGDIRTFGQRPDGTPWRVGIRNPRGEALSPLGVIPMRDGAVSTSGDYERFVEINGVRYHHILDPRTLMPTQGVASVTVTAPDGISADALATALFVMGVKDGLALVARLPGTQALFVDSAGNKAASAGWRSDPP